MEMILFANQQGNTTKHCPNFVPIWSSQILR